MTTQITAKTDETLETKAEGDNFWIARRIRGARVWDSQIIKLDKREQVTVYHELGKAIRGEKE